MSRVIGNRERNKIHGFLTRAQNIIKVKETIDDNGGYTVDLVVVVVLYSYICSCFCLLSLLLLLSALQVLGAGHAHGLNCI